ncbi:hypothetical protein GGF46_002576 [Coemansia sp. RSA 552]|nr:hypothetical protein GGF46_002576 [Coemansia sp. RSA 552]
MVDRTGRSRGDSPHSSSDTPFKYDIRVTGDLYANQRNNRAATKVSVKILGNEDGDVVVEQDDARSLASPTPSTEGDYTTMRTPHITHRRITDGGLELQIRALPNRRRTQAEQSLRGGGRGSDNDSERGVATPVPSRLRAVASSSSAPVTRPSTRFSEYTRSRPISSHQSFMEIRPAFDDGSLSDSECTPHDGSQTPKSLERSTSPALVGGGSGSMASSDGSRGAALPYLESRPRSSSMTQVEDKATMTTLRGFPDELRAQTPDRATESDAESDTTMLRPDSTAENVLRGGGAARPAGDKSLFSAFNGPPVAPPESPVNSGSGCPKSVPRQQLRPRQLPKDKCNYRERVENLLTQYFPVEILEKYLDELRHRYRFIGSGGMPPEEIARLLDDATADSNLKEQLRASLEELARAPNNDASLSDSEHTVASTPSQRHYLSVRGTELRNVLDRTSVSPAPKQAPRFPPATSSNLFGGGVSIEDMGPASAGTDRGTMRSDRMSVAASVIPSESGQDADSSVRSGTQYKSRTRSMPTPDQKQELPSTPQPSTPKPSTPQPSTPKPSTPQPDRSYQSTSRPREGASAGGPSAPGPDYWEDGDKFKVRPPDMSRAFKVLRSQPIFVREMPSADFNFKSPFSHHFQSASPDARPSSSSRHAAGSAASRGSKFSERHPVESKVAKAVSELEEVLRRTEADTVAAIENDFESSCSKASSRSAPTSHGTRGSARNTDAESVVSRDSLVGGGASSRASSVATRISAIGSKYDAMRPESAEKLSASQSTIRTDMLFKEGIEYGDADRIDEEDDNEPVVPVERAENNDSSITLPMPVDDMPPELAAVLRRTGGVDESRLRRTSAASRQSTARTELLKSEAASQRSSVRSAATRASAAAPVNRSLTELDIVMGRTGGNISRSAVSSRASAASAGTDVLRGGSGTPNSPVTPVAPVANDSEDELASVMRRTSGYAPSTASSSSASLATERRPDSAASELKSVYPPQDAARPSSAVSSQHPSRASRGLREQASPVSRHASPLRNTEQSPARPAPRPSAEYASSPLRGRPYQPAGRQTPPRAARQPMSPPPPPPPPQNNEADDGERSQAPPSPMPYRLPTPVFGRFPSPPPHIKNRAQAQADSEEEPPTEIQPQESARQPPPPPPPNQVRRDSSRSRSQSQSVANGAPTGPVREFQEDPVVDRLDLETGSLASRRSRPRNGSEFGSTSTLMNAHSRDGLNLPKVVEEDVDSFASFHGSQRARSPQLRGGGAPRSFDRESQAPTTLRGGGRTHPTLDVDCLPSRPTCDGGCCGVCGEGIDKSDLVVRPQIMHASCLRCEACDCLLTTSTFRAINGHVYCEKDYKRYFHSEVPSTPKSKVVSMRPGVSDAKFQEMNRAIMESFTSVDDFLQHMRQLRERNGQRPDKEVAAYAGDPSQVQRNGDMGVDRQTHYEREQMTSPSGTPWITERIVDKKVKTKVLEKRYPADGSQASSIKSRSSVPHEANDTTLTGGGRAQPKPASRADALRATNHSSASRPSTALLNDTKAINGWEHPMCPVCSSVVYLNDRVLHEGYGYHRACMRCHRCSQVTPAASAVRIKGAIYCKKHGTELLRRRSILMRKKSTMGRRSRHNRTRGSMPSDRATTDPAFVAEPAPPVPAMPMYAASGDAKESPPRRVTTALRNFLEAAAEQIESQTFAPTTPEPQTRQSPTPPPSQYHSKPAPSPAAEHGARRPLPVPKIKPNQLKNLQKQQQQQQPPRPTAASHISSPPQSPGPNGRSNSRSIFSGSRESLYDPNVVNALRQEAQRQIGGSQGSLPLQPASPSSRSRDPRGQTLLSPCGPSIADALQKYQTGRNGRISVSSGFDPFEASQEPLNSNAAAGFTSPNPNQPSPFNPNAQLDNLERRFRNANFRPPWALKSQSMLQ